MSSSIGRKIQAAIDRMRGKQRQTDPADAWGMSRRDARKFVQPAGALEAVFYGHKGRIAYRRISEHGVYVCEDLHCSYWPTHEGGLRRDGTFVEHVKTLIDRLQGWYLDGGAQTAAMPFASTTYGIFIYLDLIVIEKRPISRPFHVQMGESS